MPKVFQILHKAYVYTKNHKFLWFFGFFLTGGGVFDFSKTSDPDRIAELGLRIWKFLMVHPAYMSLALSGLVVGLIIAFVLIGVCRGALITATVRLERKEPINFRIIIRSATKYAWRIAGISFFANLCLVLIFSWLFVPVFYLIRQGFDLRAFFLAVVAMAIFLPLVIALSLVNIFSANFVGVYNLSLKAGIKSAFDLLGRFWYRGVPLLFTFFAAYFLLYFLSSDILGLIGLLAFGVAFLLKSLSIPFILGIVSVLMTAIMVGFVVLLLIMNAALNVFANIGWTLFFMDIVKDSRLPEEPKPSVVIEPISPVT